MPRKKIARKNNRSKPHARIEFPRNGPNRNELHHRAFQLVRGVIGGVIGPALPGGVVIGGVVTGGIVIGDVESHHPLPANQEVLSGADFR